jgi:hypothetical protein
MYNERVVAKIPEGRIDGEDTDIRLRRLQNKTLPKQGKTKTQDEIIRKKRASAIGGGSRQPGISSCRPLWGVRIDGILNDL